MTSTPAMTAQADFLFMVSSGRSHHRPLPPNTDS